MVHTYPEDIGPEADTMKKWLPGNGGRTAVQQISGRRLKVAEIEMKILCLH